MVPVHTILVPTDLSACAERAYAPAAGLAARYGADLRVVRVAEYDLEPAAYVSPTTWDDVAAGLRLPPGLEPPRGPIHVEEVPSPVYVPVRRSMPDVGLRKPAAMVLREYAAEHDVDLIVMATHGRRGFRRFLMGSVAERLVRTAPCPVLTVPCEGDASGDVVVAPVDFSDSSREGLAYAKSVAAQRGVPLHVVHVVDTSAALIPALVGPGLRRLADVEADVRGDLERFVRETPGPRLDAVVMSVVEGDPAYAVRDYAAGVAAGVIVVATQGRTGFDRLVMGSVSERLLRLAPCPVLTVPPPTARGGRWRKWSRRR